MTVPKPRMDDPESLQERRLEEERRLAASEEERRLKAERIAKMKADAENGKD